MGKNTLTNVSQSEKRREKTMEKWATTTIRAIFFCRFIFKHGVVFSYFPNLLTQSYDKYLSTVSLKCDLEDFLLNRGTR